MVKYLLLFLLSSGAFAGELYINTSIEHTSNPFVTEQGYGLNAAFVDLEYFGDNGLYISGGLGYHQESLDCPEVCFGNSALARLKFGYRFKL